METLTPSALKARFDAGTDTAVLDVREPWEYEICHISGSLNIPMAQIPRAFERLDPRAATVVVCHHGMRSQQVAEYLERRGFPKVANLDGGIDAWAADVEPGMARY